MKLLFGTKFRFFWVIIPMLMFLSLALIYNPYADGLLKLYPLIIFICGCIIFTFVFLFRVVGMGFDEVRTIGLFSSRERVIVNEGKLLTLTLLPKKKILVELFGNDGVLAELDWLVLNEDGSVPDINLFRAKAIGGMSSVVRVLKFYGLSAEDAASVIDGGERYQDEIVSVYATESNEGNKQLNIKFLATI